MPKICEGYPSQGPLSKSPNHHPETEEKPQQPNVPGIGDPEQRDDYKRTKETPRPDKLKPWASFTVDRNANSLPHQKARSDPEHREKHGVGRDQQWYKHAEGQYGRPTSHNSSTDRPRHVRSIDLKRRKTSQARAVRAARTNWSLHHALRTDELLAPTAPKSSFCLGMYGTVANLISPWQ